MNSTIKAFYCHSFNLVLTSFRNLNSLQLSSSGRPLWYKHYSQNNKNITEIQAHDTPNNSGPGKVKQRTHPGISSHCQPDKEQVSAFFLSKYSTSAKREKRGCRIQIQTEMMMMMMGNFRSLSGSCAEDCRASSQVILMTIQDKKCFLHSTFHAL